MSQPTAEGISPPPPERAVAAPGRAESALSALVAAGLTGAVAAGAGLPGGPYLLVVAAVQALLIAAWWTTVRPSGRTAAAVVATGAAVAADLAVLLAGGGTIGPVVGVVAVAFVATVVAQLARGVGRAGITESFGSTMLLTVLCCALAAATALRERPGGPDVIALCVAAAGAGLVVAHLADAVRSRPELSPGTGRGAIGIFLGGVAGGAAAVAMTRIVTVPDVLAHVYAAPVGVLVALTAVLVDVGQVCALVGRERAGEPVPVSWLGPVLGPGWGVVAAVVGAYVVGNVVLG
jgi:hypothetical protein